MSAMETVSLRTPMPRKRTVAEVVDYTVIRKLIWVYFLLPTTPYH